MVVVNINSLENIVVLLERLRNILLVQQRGTRYDEFTDSYVPLTAAQITALQTARTNILANLQTLVATLT